MRESVPFSSFIIIYLKHMQWLNWAILQYFRWSSPPWVALQTSHHKIVQSEKFILNLTSHCSVLPELSLLWYPSFSTLAHSLYVATRQRRFVALISLRSTIKLPALSARATSLLNWENMKYDPSRLVSVWRAWQRGVSLSGSYQVFLEVL